jgi:hypothetical protein
LDQIDGAPSTEKLEQGGSSNHPSDAKRGCRRQTTDDDRLPRTFYGFSDSESPFHVTKNSQGYQRYGN